MKAAQLTGPETIELVELPVPACPDDGVLLQVRACGVCGSDLRRWREGPAPGGITVPGHEFAGVVVEVGAQVTRLPRRRPPGCGAGRPLPALLVLQPGPLQRL